MAINFDPTTLPADMQTYLNGLTPFARAAATWVIAHNPSGAVANWQARHPSAASTQSATQSGLYSSGFSAHMGGSLDPTRALPPAQTGGQLPPAQARTRVGGMLPGQPNGNTGIVPPSMPVNPRPGATAMTGQPRAPQLPAAQTATLPASNAQGMRMAQANPVGRPAGGLFGRMQ